MAAANRPSLAWKAHLDYLRSLDGAQDLEEQLDLLLDRITHGGFQ